MATKYADRAFVKVNGVILFDLQSAELRQTTNSRAVPSMTNDGWNKGFVRGNTDIDITCAVAVQNTLASPKMEALNFEENDISINFECGADIYSATGVFLKTMAQNAGGIGDEVKKTFEFGALKLTDAAGNSSLFNLLL